MTVHAELLTKLWGDTDPFACADLTRPFDAQGWNSYHHYLVDAMHRHRPGVVVEVGVWKGASTFTMASRLREMAVDGAVIAVDTWCGSAEHWLSWGHRRDLYDQFASNVMAMDLQSHVVPLPLDSANACWLMRAKGIQASVVHIDGAHDGWSVLTDLIRWWDVLTPGGQMIVDDYNSSAWPGVTWAVDYFAMERSSLGFEHEMHKCRFFKPE